ncbi:hypothetical protein [Rhizobium phage RHph_X66]|nr:hypothetical protein [Rhizobium phage RHph_X66]
MTHMEFVQHAGAIRMAIISAIEVYMARNGLPFSTDDFVSQKETDLAQVGKEALFYGAAVIPDATAASAPGS